MAQRYNPPPGWEVPAEDWTPPRDWTPDPSWPPAPDGWIFWLDLEQKAKHRQQSRFGRTSVAAIVIIALLGAGAATHSLSSQGPRGVALPSIPAPTLTQPAVNSSAQPGAITLRTTPTTAPTNQPTATTAQTSVGSTTTPTRPPRSGPASPTVTPTDDCPVKHAIRKFFGLCPTPPR